MKITVIISEPYLPRHRADVNTRGLTDHCNAFAYLLAYQPTSDWSMGNKAIFSFCKLGNLGRDIVPQGLTEETGFLGQTPVLFHVVSCIIRVTQYNHLLGQC